MGNNDFDPDLQGPLAFIVAWRPDHLEGGRLKLHRRVANRLRAMCSDVTRELGTYDWLQDDPEIDLASGECMFLERASLTPVPEVIALTDSFDTLPELSAHDLGELPLLFYGVVLGRPPAGYAFIHKSNPNLSAKSGRILTLLQDGLTELEEPVLSIDPGFDFIITPDQVVVLSLYSFGLFFRDTAPLQTHVHAYVSRIASHLPLDPEAQAALERLALQKPRVRSRLRALFQRDYLGSVTIPGIRAYLRAQDIDPGRVIKRGRLVLDPADEQLLLTVLNEDLFVGPLSGIHYRTGSKVARA